MSFNGSGVFTPAISFVADKNSAIGPQASRFDTVMDDIATGLSTAICRDGQTTITANIPFSNRKITGLGDATAETDALNMKVARANWFSAGTAGGSATALTLTPSMAVTAYVQGLHIYVQTASNSGAGATIAVSGLVAKTILKPPSAAIEAGDWKSGDLLDLLYDGTNFRWLNKWRHSDVPAGTFVPLANTVVPVGWSQHVDANWNDVVLRFTQTLGDVAGLGGSWTISGFVTDVLGEHTHTGTTDANANDNGKTAGGVSSPAFAHTHAFTTGASGSHGHNVTNNATWRPKYANLVLCVRDT